MKLTQTLFIAGLICCHTVLAQTVYTKETVPNVKLTNNSYVSNPDGILTDEAVVQINETLGELENQTTVQVAVVAVNSIGSADIFDFAQGLFELWGIGHAQKDNGLLILLVTDQRTVRFHTGYGLEGVLPDALCKEIQRDQMVPSFQADDYSQGMLDGIKEVAHVLSDPSYREELQDIAGSGDDDWDVFFLFASIFGSVFILFWYLALLWSGNFYSSKKEKEEKKKKKEKKLAEPEMIKRKGEWLLIFAAGPIGLLLFFNTIRVDGYNHILVFLVAIYLYLGFSLFFRRIKMARVIGRYEKSKDYFAAVTFMNEYQVYWLVMAILFPLPSLFFYFQYNIKKSALRNHPRDCKNCGQLVKKLDEQADDQYLQQSQVFEENLHSVDYDVWLCGACQSTEILNYINRFSKYEPCPYCKTKALYTESRRTVAQPTYESSGSGEKTSRCKYCKKTKISTYSIAQLTRSSSGGSSGSSSGGSWGGGSSGGGGSSSSW